MEKWPIGVFASIDAGLGVKLEVAHELGISTVHLHAPHRQTRTPNHARRFLDRLGELGITITAVFGGFEGESYADIPHGNPHGRLGSARYPVRTGSRDGGDFRFLRTLGLQRGGLAPGIRAPQRQRPGLPRGRRYHAAALRLREGQRAELAPGNRPRIGGRPAGIHRRRQSQQLVRELRPREYDPLRFGRTHRGPAKDRPVRAEHPLQGWKMGGPSRRGVGRRSSFRAGRRRPRPFCGPSRTWVTMVR